MRFVRWLRMWWGRVVFLVCERDGWCDDDTEEWRQ